MTHERTDQYNIHEQIDRRSRRSKKRADPSSINIWDDAIRDKFFVCLPVLTVSIDGRQRRERGGG